MPKISKIGHFWPKSRKKAFFPGFTRKRPKRAFFGPLPRGFYINPSRRGPAVPAGVGSPEGGRRGTPSLLPGEPVAPGRITGCSGPSLKRILRTATGTQTNKLKGSKQPLSTSIDLYPPGSPGPHTPCGSPGDSAPYPFQGGTPSGTAGPRREGLM